MSYTSLHRAAGALPGRVNAGMLQQAVDGKLGESDELDGKQDRNDLKENREVAKDFAALVNAAGGIIVTGVAENGTGEADSLPGVDDARAQALANKFRGIANSLVTLHPRLHRLHRAAADRPGPLGGRRGSSP